MKRSLIIAGLVLLTALAGICPGGGAAEGAASVRAGPSTHPQNFEDRRSFGSLNDIYAEVSLEFPKGMGERGF